MSGAGILFWAAVAYMRFYDNKRRFILFSHGSLYSAFNHFNVITISHRNYLPPVCSKTAANIFGKGAVRIPFNGNIVIIIQIYQLAETKGACKGCCLRGYPLHQVTIGHYDIGIVVYDRKVGTIKRAG